MRFYAEDAIEQLEDLVITSKIVCESGVSVYADFYVYAGVAEYSVEIGGNVDRMTGFDTLRDALFYAEEHQKVI